MVKYWFDSSLFVVIFFLFCFCCYFQFTMSAAISAGLKCFGSEHFRLKTPEIPEIPDGFRLLQSLATWATTMLSLWPGLIIYSFWIHEALFYILCLISYTLQTWAHTKFGSKRHPQNKYKEQNSCYWCREINSFICKTPNIQSRLLSSIQYKITFKGDIKKIIIGKK